MNNELIRIMQSTFDSLARTVPDENVEFWFARDLMEPLGYARWENFITAIQRAITSCETMGYKADDHFRGVTKMVALGSGAGDRRFSAHSIRLLPYRSERRPPQRGDRFCSELLRHPDPQAGVDRS